MAGQISLWICVKMKVSENFVLEASRETASNKPSVPRRGRGGARLDTGATMGNVPTGNEDRSGSRSRAEVDPLLT